MILILHTFILNCPKKQPPKCNILPFNTNGLFRYPYFKKAKRECNIHQLKHHFKLKKYKGAHTLV